MSQTLLSAAYAAMLLAASASQPTAAGAPPATRIVHVFVTVLDKSGKVILKSDAQVEQAKSTTAMAAGSGAKMSLPTKDCAVVQVLVPGGQCSVTLTPKATAGGRVTIVFDWRKDARKCSVAEPAAEARPASAPASGSCKRDSGFPGSPF
jgi:hypothetical protein